MKISIRMDDITPDMDWEKFLRFRALCDRYQIRPLIGIVPENRDRDLHRCEPQDAPVKDFWAYVRALEEEGWCIAQHGVHHQYTTKKMGRFPLNRLSELAGLGYEAQYGLLKKGRDILRSHGIMTDLFMAPAHSFDKDTVRALKRLGFRGITDGFGDHPYIRWGMTFYPISFCQADAFKRTKGYTTFVVHANTMDEKDLERYERLFSRYQDQFISYGAFLAVSPRRRGLSGDLGEYAAAAAKSAVMSLRKLKG